MIKSPVILYADLILLYESLKLILGKIKFVPLIILMFLYNATVISSFLYNEI